MKQNLYNLYKDTLKNVCEKDVYSFNTIVELEKPNFLDKTIPNENADFNSLLSYKLDETKATDNDYKEFIEYAYSRVGKENELNELFNNQGETDMEKEKIENLLLKYGAPKDVVKDFMDDLYEIKQDTEKMDEFEKDKNKGSDEYKDFAKDNNIDDNDEKLKEMANDEKGHEDFLLNAKNVALLKATQEGKKLLINAPTMAKDELEKAIKEYLTKNKGE